MSALKTCPICGSRKIGRVIKTLKLARSSANVEVAGVAVDVCRNCGEEILDSAASRKVDSAAFSPAPCDAATQIGLASVKKFK